MSSRMAKYYSDKNDTAKRTERNKKIYDNIYEDVEYTNIENITNIEKTNQVDLEAIKSMLNRNEKKVVLTEKEEILEVVPEEIESHDIKTFIDKAKDQRETVDTRKKSLDDTDYNILKNLNVANKDKQNQEQPSEEKLKELIHTITNTKLLNDLNNEELSEKILADLQAGKTEVIEKPVDKTHDSFYTSSLNFKDNDFEDLKELNKSVEKNTKVIAFLLGALFFIMAGLMAYIVWRII